MSEKRFRAEVDAKGHLKIITDGETVLNDSYEVVDLLNEQQATITKLEQICEKKMQEIENIKYSLKEIAYKYQKEVQFKADTDPNQAVKEVLDEQQATINEYKENWDNLVEKASEIAKRNVVLDEEIGQLQRENEQLKSYIDTIFEGNTHICKKLDIEDVQFYCQRNRDYRFPTCTYAKCFDEENLIEVKEEIRKCFDE